MLWRNKMDSQIPANAGAARDRKQVLMKDIATNWPKFSPPEIDALKSREELVAGVQAKYRLDATQARREVDDVLNGRSF
jgi:hypothetical protein